MTLSSRSSDNPRSHLCRFRSDRAAISKRTTDPRAARHGLTLLEILLASAILATALTVLAQQNSTGVQAALRSHLETDAAILCQSQLNLLLNGKARSLPITDQAIEDAPRWRFSATMTEAPVEDSFWLTVQVHQPGPHESISRFALVRLIRSDRNQRLSAALGGGHDER